MQIEHCERKSHTKINKQCRNSHLHKKVIIVVKKYRERKEQIKIKNKQCRNSHLHGKSHYNGKIIQRKKGTNNKNE